jgi:hypothetical protein
LGANPDLGILNPLTLDPGWKTRSGTVARVKKYMNPGILILFHPESVIRNLDPELTCQNHNTYTWEAICGPQVKVRNGSGSTARAGDPDPYQYNNTINTFFLGHL